MGFKQIRTSDLTGVELKEADVVTVAVKSAGKVFDAAAEELSALKRLTNVIELEFRHPDGELETVLCSKTEFEKLVSTAQLDTFDNLRGRRSGFSPRRSE
ncbi:hypothetical protein [Williamsia sterculiae]|uniref:Uncharacterized protein n=1 Tax=Williamsia sterculiae TaxID=1344003 RepID=A0A1N7GHW3_9NOCA|nr:hypothetical protein [Williamsia sterculiae]SIS12177.1 hypothetical protein SAMN05445060_2809 [Williamsia sterculiae]